MHACMHAWVDLGDKLESYRKAFQVEKADSLDHLDQSAKDFRAKAQDFKAIAKDLRAKADDIRAKAQDFRAKDPSVPKH